MARHLSGGQNVVVIGAGVGGIATAARLAQHGYRVTVVEKCEQAGGRCGHLKLGGYVFDTGATLFLMKELYERTFTELGEHLEDHLSLQRIDPTYHLHFRDESQLELTSDLQVMEKQLEAMEPGSFDAMLRYLVEGRDHYTLSMDRLVGREFRSLFEFFGPQNLLLFLRLRALSRHSDYTAGFFHDPRLQIAFTFHDMYMGLSPFNSPATYSFLQYTELANGLWYPRGGMYQIVESLKGIAEKQGVEFLYRTPVERIMVNGERATGVALGGGRELAADLVVANADLGYVYRKLLPQDGTSERLDRKEYGCSTIMFYWGTDKQYSMLGPHNLFFSGDYRQSFAAIFEGDGMPDQPNFYVHAPVRLDPSMAPSGHDALVVAVPVGPMREEKPQDWHGLQTKARAYVLERLARCGLADLESHIRVEASVTPPDWKNRYNLTRGSAHGLSHKLIQMGYLRPHHRHAHFRNLYFVGASTHPGTGLPSVLTSARLVAARILEDHGDRHSFAGRMRPGAVSIEILG
jgi:phytoene desaturase